MSLKVPTADLLIEQVFSITNVRQFNDVALQVFNFQYCHNKLYQRYTQLLNINPATVSDLEHIPFLPISFFKTHPVLTTDFEPQFIFESSGTTGYATSRHYIKDKELYETSFLKAFELFYGPVKEYCILGLLPSYLERQNSSLIYMVNRLMEQSNHPLNKFYLSRFEELHQTLATLEAAKQKTILFGVTYALLDFAAAFPMLLNHTTIIETGGMKGRKKEVIRKEVHQELAAAFSRSSVHSEYGMTELLSQAYAQKTELFSTPPWMKVALREEDDPKKIIYQTDHPASGVLNVVDLANIFSCSFIATEDAGKLHGNGSFEVMGRLDNSDIRGCSLLAF